ncbi:MAG: hypothetical protein R2865_06680 [Deinococcales bacterium]
MFSTAGKEEILTWPRLRQQPGTDQQIKREIVVPGKLVNLVER